MIKKRPPRLTIEALEGTACRAVYQGAHEQTRIEFTIKHREGEVILLMSLEQASKFIQDSLIALDAAIPKLPKL